MNTRSGAQISQKAFLQSVGILLLIMIIAGVLTRAVPSGVFDRMVVEGREMIQPESYREIPKPDYPVWRWFTAPVEVLWGEDSLLVIVIIVFILMVGSSFAVMERCGILKAGLDGIIKRFENRKYLLLSLISLFFMVLGAFFGIFEEVVPLVPISIALSYYLGWDALVGLGMSILATNLGFTAAITNPFTIGVAQEIAGLPLFSGTWFRLPIFLCMYLALDYFLIRYARKVEKVPHSSSVYKEDQQMRMQQVSLEDELELASKGRYQAATIWFAVFTGLIVIVLIASPLIPGISDIALPLVGLLFLIAGVGAGFLSGIDDRSVLQALWDGVRGIAPGILLILMAVSIKHIVITGRIMDTIIYQASRVFSEATPFVSALGIFALALLIEFFVSSGSAKAFLLMPLLVPLSDLVGITRQIAVTAYCFGDGFSNMFYPTSPVLLISLGLTVVSYPKWIRWTLPLWGLVISIAIGFLGIAVAIGFGPF